jgi:hypothetical protein
LLMVGSSACWELGLLPRYNWHVDVSSPKAVIESSA